jgi:hypothetical protein
VLGISQRKSLAISVGLADNDDAPVSLVLRNSIGRLRIVTAVVIRNTREGEQPPTPPTKDDGSLFLYAMHFDGNKFVAFSDSQADLIEALIPGYLPAEDADEPVDPQAQLVERIKFAINCQVVVQAYLVADTPDDVWDALTEDQQNVLVGDRVSQPDIDKWEAEVPLVLVDTAYAPHSDRPRPESAADTIIWVSPLTEESFLMSLAELGVIGLSQAS